MAVATTLKTFSVLGLYPSQFREVEKRLRNVAHLLHVQTDKVKNVDVLKGDGCIITTKFVHHASCERARVFFPKSKIHFANGGVKSVVDIVSKLVKT